MKFPGTGHFNTPEKRRQMFVYIVFLVTVYVGIHLMIHVHDDHRLGGSRRPQEAGFVTSGR